MATVVAVAALVLTPAPARADATRDAQWHLRSLDVTAAHTISQGEGVTVAVVDTGVDATHPDLAGAVKPGIDLTGDSGGGLRDTYSHGTSMAGLIAARGRPGGAGALGIAPKATVVSVRVDRAGDLGIPEKAAEGIEWAARNGARVICLASGGTDPRAYTKALEVARQADAVVVAGTGNRPRATSVVSPAKLPGVLAVGAVDQSGAIAPFSATGPEVVIAAPGTQITSTGLSKTYNKTDGTSDATAIVAGAVALVRAKYPDLDAPGVINRLTATSTDRGAPGRDPAYGFGVLDLMKALTADVTHATPSAGPSGSGQATPKSADDGSNVGLMTLLVGAFCLVGVLGGGGLLVAVLRRRR